MEAFRVVADAWDLLFYNYKVVDPRTSNWLFMGNVMPSVLTVFIYRRFATQWGPAFMKNREPYNLKTLLIIHNLVQLILSIVIVFMGVQHWFDYGFLSSLICHPVDRTRSARAMRAASQAHLYYMAKILELLDTVFFVLRKKFNQVSFLHVYHHSAMLLCAWMGAKYFPGGFVSFLITANSSIHVIMYTYYLLSSLGPKYQKYLWWKKYLTLIQMIQFTICAAYSSQAIFVDCDIPRLPMACMTMNLIIFYFFFNEFYQTNYQQNNGKVTSENKKED